MTSRAFVQSGRSKLRRLTSSHRNTAWLGGALFALLYSYPLLMHLTLPGSNYDWDFSLEMAWTPFYTVRHFHQIPLWNPYKCGGLPMLANPQSRVLTPMFLLHLACGPMLGLHLEIILHLAIAWAGGYLLGRALGMRPLGAVVAATLFPASSWFYLHLGEGHAVMLPVAYLPWLALCLWRSFERYHFSYAIAAGAILALMFGEGGVYAVTYCGFVIGFLAVGAALVRLSLIPLLEVALSGLFAAGFAAIKLLPSRNFVSRLPRPIGVGYATDWHVFAVSLFSFDQDKLRPSVGGFGFHEYGAYIGIGFALLALCSLLASPRKTAPWLLAALAILDMSRGENPLLGVSLWKLLHHYPIFASERLPSRWYIPLVFVISVLAGFGADVLSARRARVGYAAAATLLLIGAAECWWTGPPNLQYVLARPEPALVQPRPEFHQMWIFAKSIMFTIARNNGGALNCYEYEDMSTPARGANQTGYRGEAYFTDGTTMKTIEWSPNQLRYGVAPPHPDTLVINQNFNPSWRLTTGKGVVISDSGLLAVELPAGSQQLTLTYRDRAFLRGLAITLLTILLAAILMLHERARTAVSARAAP